MDAQITIKNQKPVLTILPYNDTELYAFRCWEKENGSLDVSERLVHNCVAEATGAPAPPLEAWLEEQYRAAGINHRDPEPPTEQSIPEETDVPSDKERRQRIQEVKSELDVLGVPYKNGSRLETLEALLEQYRAAGLNHREPENQLEPPKEQSIPEPPKEQSIPESPKDAIDRNLVYEALRGYHDSFKNGEGTEMTRALMFRHGIKRPLDITEKDSYVTPKMIQGLMREIENHKAV